MKIVAVVGARPNFVKISPILAACRESSYVNVALVHTGQHYDENMSDAFFADLDIPAPDINLGVRGESSVSQIAEIMTRLEPILHEKRPAMVIVVGDVNSTLAGALVAAKLSIPVAHVEAGLRSFDRRMPEELNRVLTDSVSELLFTTEPAANENLRREGIPEERIHFVGNVMVDTLLRYRERARSSRILAKLGLEAGRYAALTLHRPSNVDRIEALRRVLSGVARIQDETRVVFPVHPRARRQIEAMGSELPWMSALQLTEPLAYLDFIQLMENARCVLTDSGGIQEETTALGVPCLTLRSNTERPITVAAGTNEVVGVDPAAIYAAWRRVVEGRWKRGGLPSLWDGNAARRIVGAIVAWMGSHDGRP